MSSKAHMFHNQDPDLEKVFQEWKTDYIFSRQIREAVRFYLKYKQVIKLDARAPILDRLTELERAIKRLDEKLDRGVGVEFVSEPVPEEETNWISIVEDL